jgi:hypothetical protein
MKTGRIAAAHNFRISVIPDRFIRKFTNFLFHMFYGSPVFFPQTHNLCKKRRINLAIITLQGFFTSKPEFWIRKFVTYGY